MNIIKYGTLTRWLIDRNYGFIKEDSGLDVFIHVSGFSDKVAPPQNTRLKFHLAPNPQKPNREMASMPKSSCPAASRCSTAKAVNAMSNLDLQALKKQVGLTPFSQRLPLNEGFAACPFHNGDGEKSFHVVQKEDGAFIGTCFSACQKSFDAIAFVAQYDNISTGDAIRKLRDTNGETMSLPPQKTAKPMTAGAWEKLGRPVTDNDVNTLAASRPKSKTPSASTLNAMGFKIGALGHYHRTVPTGRHVLHHQGTESFNKGIHSGELSFAERSVQHRCRDCGLRCLRVGE